MFVASAVIALLGAVACFVLVRQTTRVTEGPIFGRRSRWIYANTGRTPAITRHPAAAGYALTSSNTTPPADLRHALAPGRAWRTEPRPWRISISRPTSAHSRSAAEPVASSSSTPASGTNTRSRTSPAGSSIHAQHRPPVAVRRAVERVDRRRRVELDELEGRPHSGFAEIRTSPSSKRDGALAGRRAQHGHVDPCSRSSHADPTSGCPASGSSTSGVKMRSSAALAVVDEDGLGVAQVARDRLALALGHLGAVEEDAERVAARAVGAQKTRSTCRVAAPEPGSISGGSGGGR